MNISSNDKACYVQMEGDISSLDALTLRKELEQLVKGDSSLILDITQVKELDLTGFNALLMTFVLSIKKGGTFRIVAHDDHPLYDYLEMTHFKGLLTIDNQVPSGNTKSILH